MRSTRSTTISPKDAIEQAKHEKCKQTPCRRRKLPEWRADEAGEVCRVDGGAGTRRYVASTSPCDSVPVSIRLRSASSIKSEICWNSFSKSTGLG